jgi:hypothetical protein
MLSFIFELSVYSVSNFPLCWWLQTNEIRAPVMVAICAQLQISALALGEQSG